MLELGTAAPDFNLPDLTGASISLTDYAGKPLLVIFSCNHCPYVLHILNTLTYRIHEYQSMGLSCVMINANNTQEYPQDSPEKMCDLSSQYSFTFPYLFDESQQVARAYQAACTPDFFLFDKAHHLYYRGQFDGSRPGNNVAVDGKDLTTAVENLLQGKDYPAEQHPSLGCNIKWKPGNEPEYFS